MAKAAKPPLPEAPHKAAAPPPPGEPSDVLGALVRDLFLEYRRALQAELQPRDISLPQWTFLRILWKEDGLTQKAISEKASIHPSTTVDTLRTLEKEGLVERHPDPDDGRAWRVFLTRKGRALEPQLLPCALAVNERAVAGLTPRQADTLRRTLARVLANLQA